MTYLQLINGVLKRLRENQVDTADANEYSTLIGALVNDAKSQIESSHSWSALRNTAPFSTTDGTIAYTVEGLLPGSIILSVFNLSSKKRMIYSDSDFFNRAYLTSELLDGPPTHFRNLGVNNGLMRLQVYPVPDAAYLIFVNAVIKQADLDADATEMLIPHQPVLQLAYAMALRERGESGGQSGQEQMIHADRVLSDYIAIDANYFPAETAFVVV